VRGRGSEREGREREERQREIKEIIVWLCCVSSLGMLGERDRGKEGEREGERDI
jgi:hypothetical protein